MERKEKRNLLKCDWNILLKGKCKKRQVEVVQKGNKTLYFIKDNNSAV